MSARPTPAEPWGTPQRQGERGVVLLVVLVVVALLTIIVTEFTYSVTLDRHRARNAVNALQASLLARSGINIAEGFLVQDGDVAFDAYSEQWWQDLTEFCTGIELDATMRIKCQVEDESGKININNTRTWRQPAGRAVNTPGAARPTPAAQPQTPDADLTPDAFLRDALRRMFEAYQIDVQIVDQLKEYWLQDPPASSAPIGRLGSQVQAVVPDFSSLEDFAATFRIPTPQLQRLRRLLTARPSRDLRAINVNTAPVEVLAAVINDGDAVAKILERQQIDGEPIKGTGEVAALLSGIEHADIIARLFDCKSRLFRLQASALANADPTGQQIGGIGQTLSVLVLRQQDLRNRRPAGSQGPGWTLKPLDWQKEGGARLLRRSQEDVDRSDLFEQSNSPQAGLPRW